MYVIEVIPLTSLPPNVPQILSYFFDQEIAKGALVEASLGPRNVPAVVISCISLEEQKIAVKKTDFQLKKLNKVLNPEPLVSEIQLRITAWLARHYHASLGMALKTILPPFFNKKGYVAPAPDAPQRTPQKPRLVSLRAKDIPAFLKKESRKVRGQVLIVAPEMATARYYHGQLPGSGLLTSDIGSAEYKSLWASVAAGDVRVICSSRIGLFLPFKNLELVIIDDPDHEAYKSDMSPRYNGSDVAQKIGELYDADVVMLTSQPSVHQEFAIKEGGLLFEDLRPKKTPQPELMNMVLEIRTGNFSLFAKSFQDGMIQALARKQQVLLFSSRRAYSGVLMCRQCDLVFQCKNCRIPLRVHKTSETLLICYHCSAYHSLPAFCPNCNSAKLKNTGMAGSQKIKEEVDALVAQHNLPVSSFILDSDLILDGKDEENLLKQYSESSQAVLIATQMIFSHRHALNFDFIGIPTADGLVTAPDFRNEERFLYQYEKLLDFNPSRMMLQTYHPEAPIFTALASRNYAEFTEQELAARKLLKYPPFTRLIKLTHKHRDQKKAFLTARLLAEKLAMAIQQFKLSESIAIAGPSPATIAQENNMFAYTIWIKVSPALERLDSILKYVPSGWIIDVDPTSSV